MIWLWSNLWWIGPLAILLALTAHPIPRAFIKAVDPKWWVRLGVVALFGLTFQCGRWYERSAIEKAQEAAEADGLAKAKEAGKRAHGRAQAATKDIDKESTDADTKVREIVRYLPASCPPLPPELHDLLKRQAEGANSGVQAGS